MSQENSEQATNTTDPTRPDYISPERMEYLDDFCKWLVDNDLVKELD